MERKRTDFPVKEKFCAQQSVKKVMLIVFWDMKGLITIDFLEKSATQNNASYCQLLRKNPTYLLNKSRIFNHNYNYSNNSFYLVVKLGLIC